MLPDRVSNPGPLTYKSGALPIGLHGPAGHSITTDFHGNKKTGKKYEKLFFFGEKKTLFGILEI